jgi:hypothetical protein
VLFQLDLKELKLQPPMLPVSLHLSQLRLTLLQPAQAQLLSELMSFEGGGNMRRRRDTVRVELRKQDESEEITRKGKWSKGSNIINAK